MRLGMILDFLKSAVSGVWLVLSFIGHIFSNLFDPKTSSNMGCSAFVWQVISLMFKSSMIAIPLVVVVVVVAFGIAYFIKALLGY
jgi:hypothetical protein